MFKCISCKKLQDKYISPVKVILETRERQYTNEVRLEPRGSRVIQSSGWEIVKEISVCPTCSTTKYVGKDYDTVCKGRLDSTRATA